MSRKLLVKVITEKNSNPSRRDEMEKIEKALQNGVEVEQPLFTVTALDLVRALNEAGHPAEIIKDKKKCFNFDEDE